MADSSYYSYYIDSLKYCGRKMQKNSMQNTKNCGKIVKPNFLLCYIIGFAEKQRNLKPKFSAVSYVSSQLLTAYFLLLELYLLTIDILTKMMESHNKIAHNIILLYIFICDIHIHFCFYMYKYK